MRVLIVGFLPDPASHWLFNQPQAEDREKAAVSYARLVAAMENLGISDIESRNLWAILAAIYHLGVAGAVRGQIWNRPMRSQCKSLADRARFLRSVQQVHVRQSVGRPESRQLAGTVPGGAKPIRLPRRSRRTAQRSVVLPHRVAHLWRRQVVREERRSPRSPRGSGSGSLRRSFQRPRSSHQQVYLGHFTTDFSSLKSIGFLRCHFQFLQPCRTFCPLDDHLFLS